MAKTNYISNWQLWKELCRDQGIDPYENVDFGIDKGGGNSIDYEYIGDMPEKETEAQIFMKNYLETPKTKEIKVAEDWIAGDPYWPAKKKKGNR